MKFLLLVLLLPAGLIAQEVRPDTVPITAHQRIQLQELKTEADEVLKMQSLILRTIIASKRDPKQLEGWTIQLTDSSIVLLPPPKPASTVPKKPSEPDARPHSSR